MSARRLPLLLIIVLAAWTLELSAAEPAAADLRTMIERMEREQRALRLAFRAQERPLIDVGGVLERVGRDPADLHRFVHEHTVWVPYRGHLRSTAGMLIDGSGNHFDRALLLGRLLAGAGFAVRLEGGTLDADRIAEALPEALTRARARLAAEPQVGPAREDLDERFAAALGVPIATYRSQRARLQLRSQEAQEEALLTTLAQSAHLAEVLDGRLSVGSTAEETERRFADHWWVAYREAEDAGDWRALDPLVAPGAEVAARPAEQVVAIDAIPDDQRHALRLRAIAETWQDGERREHVLLEQRIDPGARWLDSIQMVCLPLGWSPDDLAGADPAAVEEALLEQDTWWPMVALGEDDNVRQAAIDAAGRVDDRPAERAEQRKLQEGTRLLAGMGETAGATFTALWWEWTWTGPGADGVAHRRMMMDVIGPAARAAGGPAGSLDREQRLQRAIQLSTVTRVAVLDGRPSPAVVRRLSMVQRQRNHTGLVGSLDALARGDEEALIERLGSITVPAIQLKNWALLRWAWSRHRARVFVDRPQVVGFHVLTGDERRLRFGFDVVVNGTGVLPADPAAEAPPAASAIRLEQGVLDTVLETLVMRGYGESLGDNPSQLMAGDPARWQTVDEPSRLALGADWIARLAADRAAGSLVVAPRDPIGERGAVGWWRVDPATGTTLGLGRHGWGPEGTEYSVTATMTRAQLAVFRAQMFMAHNYEKIAFACAACKLASMGLTIAGVNLPQETDLACSVICAGVGEE